MLKPADFDATQPYPVIVFVYGEPAGQTVVDRWGGPHLFHRALADAGYLVVSFDNRGTPAPKGAAWRKVVYGTVGELSAKEQAAAVRAFAAKHPYVDLDADRHLGLERWRVEHAERDVPVSGHLPCRRLGGAGARPAPVRHDLPGALHGTPEGNAEGYRVGSPINFAEGLQGQLLMSMARATTTCTTRAPSGSSIGSSSSASRST